MARKGTHNIAVESVYYDNGTRRMYLMYFGEFPAVEHRKHRNKIGNTHYTKPRGVRVVFNERDLLDLMIEADRLAYMKAMSGVKVGIGDPGLAGIQVVNNG